MTPIVSTSDIATSLRTCYLDLNRFDVVAPLAAVDLQLRIGANARDGVDELHGFHAARACDWMPWLVSSAAPMVENQD